MRIEKVDRGVEMMNILASRPAGFGFFIVVFVPLFVVALVWSTFSKTGAQMRKEMMNETE